MKKKKYFWSCVISFLLAIYSYHIRSAYITQYTWKQTSENGMIGGGVLCFGTNSSYTYFWPMIKKNGKSVGIVLFCFNKRMITFSLEDRKIGYYMYI